MKVQREAAEVLDDIDALLVELRAITISKATSTGASHANVPNPRRIKPFQIGDRVVLLSRKHQCKKATIVSQKTEDFWNIVLNDGTEAYRKHTTLRHL